MSSPPKYAPGSNIICTYGPWCVPKSARFVRNFLLLHASVDKHAGPFLPLVKLTYTTSDSGLTRFASLCMTAPVELARRYILVPRKWY